MCGHQIKLADESSIRDKTAKPNIIRLKMTARHHPWKEKSKRLVQKAVSMAMDQGHAASHCD